MTCGGSEADDERMKRRLAAASASGLRAARARIAWCIVGTAVYQLGRAVAEPLEEAQRVEAGRAEDAAARGKRGEHRRDQPVNVEQRHDVEAAIVGGQAERRTDMPSRRRQVGMAERDQFRARRGAGRMQQQRDVVGFREPGAAQCADRIALQPEHAGGSVAKRCEPDHADAEPLGHGNRRAGFVFGDEDRLGADVGEVEIELVGAVGRD